MGWKSGARVSLMAALFAVLTVQQATAQEEIPPPSGGKARLVVVLSGATGSGNYRTISSRIAALGYDVVLLDSNAIIKGRQGRPLNVAGGAGIAQERKETQLLS